MPFSWVRDDFLEEILKTSFLDSKGKNSSYQGQLPVNEDDRTSDRRGDKHLLTDLENGRDEYRVGV